MGNAKISPAISGAEARMWGNRRRDFQPTEHLRGGIMAASKTPWEDAERKDCTY